MREIKDPCDLLLRLKNVGEESAVGGELAVVVAQFDVPREDLAHPYGVQGGYVASFLEAGMVWGLRTWSSSRTKESSIRDLEVSYVRACSKDLPIKVRAIADKIGSRVAFCSAELWQGHQKVACGRARFVLTTTTTTTTKAVHAMAISSPPPVPEIALYSHFGSDEEKRRDLLGDKTIQDFLCKFDSTEDRALLLEDPDAVNKVYGRMQKMQNITQRLLGLKLHDISPNAESGIPFASWLFKGREQFCRFTSRGLELQAGFALAFLDGGTSLSMRSLAYERNLVRSPSLSFRISVVGPLKPGDMYVRTSYINLLGNSAYMEGSLFDKTTDQIICRGVTTALTLSKREEQVEQPVCFANQRALL